ncbi:hypothetical protein [Mucilaginibacter sp. SG564]|uniref:hypothetical protein n=1 Tax=Mucilaginibacter sp. SG564 TaxID=2587022 RepID=UPI0015545E26|nr:hypothetical protein [Mucilaginibacter sp. SG564]
MENKKVVNSINEVVETSITVNLSEAQTAYGQLTALQKQRVDYLKPMIGDHAINIVPLLDRTGPNSWAVVHDKVSKIDKATYDEQSYQAALQEAFIINEVCQPSDVITNVSQVRSDLKLPPYLTNLKKNCETDFFNLFIVKEVYITEEVDGKSRRRFAGYKPVICLKPEVEE